MAVVLGSGMGDLAEHLATEVEVPYRAVPELESPSVPGHDGVIRIGSWAEKRVLLFSGRLHFYEGHSWRSVIEPVAVARRLGARVLLLTNAAGGIRDDLLPGNFMAVSNHLDWTHGYPWPTEKPPSPYSPQLVDVLAEAARAHEIPLSNGVYAQVTGPCYETPAEIRALRCRGGDAVGMSTVREIAWASSVGMECAAISCITNRAAGLSTGPINHEEVLAIAAAQRLRLNALIEAFIRKLI